jgi:hypothetical protein
LDYVNCVMLRRDNKTDATEGVFINHVDNWKHCRMYLDGGFLLSDEMLLLIKVTSAAIPKNHAGLFARRLSCLERLWRPLLPFSAEQAT